MNWFRNTRLRRVVAVGLALTGSIGVLQFSAPPTLAGVIGPGEGVIAVTYGRTNPTDLELAWANRGWVSVERKSRGNYTITAPMVTSTGNSQVSVLGPGAPLPLCNVVSTKNANPGTQIKVRCWSAVTGRTADAGFSLVFSSWKSNPPESEFTVLTTNKSNRTHTPTNQYRAGEGASPATVTRNKRGTYTVTIPGSSFRPNGGVMTVSATGSTPRYCNLAGWLPSGPDTVVRVDCYNRSGSRSDSLFTLTASADDLTGQFGSRAIAAWFDRTYYGDAYGAIPSGFHYAGGGGTDVARHEAQLGRSSVRGADIVLAPDQAAVTIISGYGWNWDIPENPSNETTANRCAPAAPVLDSGSQQATFEVNCYTPAGYPVPSSYTISALLIGLVL